MVCIKGREFLLNVELFVLQKNISILSVVQTLLCQIIILLQKYLML